ncbi:hypothetical protein EV08_0926 [Prochlorococcus marinus str. SS2]|nr:hypothetical protein EV08_0926 [Prochlorococcus marinus str. SS2]
MLSFWDTPETLTIQEPSRGNFLSDEIRCCIANQTKKYLFMFFCPL